MIIGILSDTHDHKAYTAKALEAFQQAGAVALVHAGDVVAPFTARLLADGGIPVHAVYGNNDGEKAGLARILPGIDPGPLRVTLGGLRFLVIHDLGELGPDDGGGADVLVHGHSHKAAEEQRGDLWVLNPGEVCAWLTGRSTVLLLDTDDRSLTWKDLT
jgi:putative phosphoesterase